MARSASLIVLIALAASGCDSGYRAVIAFDPPALADRAVHVEVALVPSCDGQPVDTGGAAVDALSQIDMTRSATSGSLGEVRAGTYGLHARARDVSCAVIAAGCVPVRLEEGGEGDLRVTLRLVSGPGCAGSDRCVGGACVMPGVDAGTRDAGMDAGDAGARDAGVGDAGPLDAGGIDAGRCTSADDRCVGDTLTTCAGGSLTSTTCALGCATGEARCARVAPSNVSPSLFDPGAPDVTISEDATWDTSTCSDVPSMTVATESAGSEVCVLRAGRFSVGGNLVVRGSRPLVVLAEGGVMIGGDLDVSANGEIPGAGGALGGRAEGEDGSGPGAGSAGRVGAYGGGGGGGGGACGAGGDGGAAGGGATRGFGGGPIGSATALEPLVGGSGGGAGSASTSPFGGAGGGALQITSQASIMISGSIEAGGGGGAAGTGTGGGAAGGGSGGSVLLEAPVISIPSPAGIRAGGGGGGGGSWLSGSGGDGEDGSVASGRAAGGGSLSGGDGGDGGGEGTLGGSDGGNTTRTGSGGGGGGGGAGCIVFRTGDGTAPTTPPSSLSPSVGPGVRALTVRVY